MKEKNFKAVELGRMYETRDERKVVVFGYDSVHQWYECVVLNTKEFYNVYEDGKYLQFKDSHNDLVKEL